MDDDRKKFQDLNRELMVLNEDYNDLIKRLGRFSQKVYELFEQINKKLNGKEQ